MKISDIVEKAKEQIAEATKLPINTVVAVSREKEKGWKVSIEMVEMKRIPDAMDSLGLYDVYLDEKGELQNFKRKSMRARGEKVIEIEEA
jgi:hypothetical protein